MKVKIYTDGACSKNPGPGGWAAVILFPQGRQEISGYEYDTTNNRMELKAVLEALKVAQSVCPEDNKQVYSDSAYVVNAINEKWLKRWKLDGWMTRDGNLVKNKDLWVKLDKMLAKTKVQFIKVKGHSSNELNNRCDKLARAEVQKIKD